MVMLVEHDDARTDGAAHDLVERIMRLRACDSRIFLGARAPTAGHFSRDRQVGHLPAVDPFAHILQSAQQHGIGNSAVRLEGKLGIDLLGLAIIAREDCARGIEFRPLYHPALAHHGKGGHGKYSDAQLH